MRIISKRTLTEFYEKHPDAEQPLKHWCDKVTQEKWESSQEILDFFGKENNAVKIIKGDRARFKIKGNSYRLIVAIDYKRHAFYIKFIGTHADYDKIDAETVDIRKSR